MISTQVSNINSAFNFYRASVDPDYSPGNKLISGLRDSAVSWAIILPLYWYCEKGATVAAGWWCGGGDRAVLPLDP